MGRDTDVPLLTTHARGLVEPTALAVGRLTTLLTTHARRLVEPTAPAVGRLTTLLTTHADAGWGTTRTAAPGWRRGFYEVASSPKSPAK